MSRLRLYRIIVSFPAHKKREQHLSASSPGYPRRPYTRSSCVFVFLSLSFVCPRPMPALPSSLFCRSVLNHALSPTTMFSRVDLCFVTRYPGENTQRYGVDLVCSHWAATWLLLYPWAVSVTRDTWLLALLRFVDFTIFLSSARVLHAWWISCLKQSYQ